VSEQIVLLGDSIFDNGAYTRGEPDVVSHLRSVLPARWRAELLARDGATTGGLAAQTARVTDAATRLIVSIGGNDALLHQDLLALPVRSSADTLLAMAARVEAFERAYRAALDAVLRLRRDTTLCTIYNGNLEEPRATAARIALTAFNDVILRAAVEQRLKLIDLRLVCREPADYANPIEPSGTGGRKIAQAIARAVGAIAADPPTQLWT
jgi:GDSL-like lipase/acylhydrolase family protein